MNPLILPGPLVSAAWLAPRLHHPDLVVLDASMAGNAAGTAPSTHPIYLPKTRIFDIELIRNQESSLPHMMPSSAQFEEQVRLLGIDRKSRIVVYDHVGVYSSPRVRWMFKAMGHEAVAVLDGGLPAWIQAGLETKECPETSITPGDFTAKDRSGFFCDADEVEKSRRSFCSRLLDARSKERFMGIEPEPRAGLKPGHIPGALNLPFADVLTNGHLRPVEELKRLFEPLVSSGDHLIFSCGSGVTACITALAAEVAGYPHITVYDGSWSEWGLPTSDRPVTTEK